MPLTTQKQVDVIAAQAHTRQKDYPAEGVPGLVLRVGPRGAAYQLRARLSDGRQVRKTVGHHPATKLRVAKLEAAKLRAEAADGRLKPARDPAKTIQSLSEKFLDQPQFSGRTRQTYSSLLRTHILPEWGSRQASDIRHDEIQLWLDSYSDRPSLALQLYGLLGGMLKFGERRGFLEDSPMRRVDRPQLTEGRTVVPTDAELLAIWRAARELGGPYGHYFQFCMATGLRRSAAAALRWSWIDWTEKTVTIPAGQTGLKQKSGARYDFVLPLSEMALSVLDEVERYQAENKLNGGEACDFVFTCDGQKPIHSFSWASSRLKILMLLHEDLDTVRADLRQHDFRRAIQTRAAEAEAEEPERCGGLAAAAHVATGHRPGDAVERTYNRSSLVPVRRRALDWWSGYLAAIVR